MPKRKEFVKEDQKFTCSNAACRWVFSKPIKIVNLHGSRSKPYEACPRCFTEIVIDSEPSTESKPVRREEVEEEETKLKSKKPEQEPTGPCAHHFGYLSEHSRNEKIPDECVMCENIVKCMLKAFNK
jgi:hypothetical protein